MSLAVLLTATACSHAPPNSAPAGTSTTKPTSTTGHGGVASAMVRRICAGPAPAVVTSVIDAPTPTYKSYAFGPSCVWYPTTGAQAASALARAITADSYDTWQHANPVTDKITVASYSAVRGTLHGGCVVLVDVDQVALDVELTGVTDPGCAATTALATAVVGSP